MNIAVKQKQQLKKGSNMTLWVFKAISTSLKTFYNKVENETSCIEVE